MSNNNKNNSNQNRRNPQGGQQPYRGQPQGSRQGGQRPPQQNGQRNAQQNRPPQNRPQQGRPQTSSQQRPDYRQTVGTNGSQISGQERFVVNISEDDYENDGAGRRSRNDRSNQRYQRLAPQQRSGQNDSQTIMRRDLAVSRTRVVTSRVGEKYEIPEESNLPPKLLRRQQKNYKSRGCVVSVVYAAIVVSISALLAFYLIVGINDMFGLVKEPMEVVVTLEDGATLDDVTKILEENGVVDYPFFFRLYANFTMDADFKHGEFTLNAKSDYDMIIRKLTRPSTADKSVVKFAIPEGYNLEQIADLLEYNCVCEKEAFFNTVKNYEYKWGFYKDIPKDEEKRVYKLEGYLFPDTYSFYIWEGSVSAINRLLDGFNMRVYDNKELDMKNKAEKLGMTMDEIIILASIIEREVPDPEEMKNVASVFYNRMKNPNKQGTGGKLQSDATKWYPYATKKAMLESETLTDKEKKEWTSPNYDTFTFSGLPAGPICCPSLNAITAALNPNKTNYYFFFTKENANGEIEYFYAETYEQHQNNYQ